MKNYEIIAYTDYVDINIALNLYSYEENLKFYTSVHKKDVNCSLNQNPIHLYPHIKTNQY